MNKLVFCNLKHTAACLEQAAACFGYAGLVFKLHDLAFILLALVNNFIEKQINVNKPHKREMSFYEYDEYEATSLEKKLQISFKRPKRASPTLFLTSI